MAFDRVEPPRPLGPVGLEPLVELAQRRGPEPVEAALGIGAHLDEAGVAQHL